MEKAYRDKSGGVIINDLSALEKYKQTKAVLANKSKQIQELVERVETLESISKRFEQIEEMVKVLNKNKETS